MMFWTIIISLGIAWVAQSYLSFRQSRAFASAFIEMRRRGAVVIGKFQGGVVQGSVVLLGIDDDGIVQEGLRLNGVTVFARFRDFTLYNGQHIQELDPAVAGQCHGRAVERALRNAVDNHKTISSGGVAVEPPTPIGRVIDNMGKWRRKKAGA